MSFIKGPGEFFKLGVATGLIRFMAASLSVILLLQGCVVYHKNPITLEQAAEQKTPVKVHFQGDETVKFKYIVEEDGLFYGSDKKTREWSIILLDEGRVQNVYGKNKSASTWITIGVIGVPIVILVIFIADAVATASLLDADF
jgi:hypothetical protein